VWTTHQANQRLMAPPKRGDAYRGANQQHHPKHAEYDVTSTVPAGLNNTDRGRTNQYEQGKQQKKC